ncbi:MAG: hypothetical protein O7C75_17615, partial [Verrucomicrobia bacterium]|nr:hypothetical protein [Verrucomicrobiota bacterium]
MERAKSAILYCTDRIARKDQKNLNKLAKGYGRNGDSFFLFDFHGVNHLGDKHGHKVHTFDFEKFKDFGIPVFGGNVVEGNGILIAFLTFFKEYPNYDYYWFFEDDVRFSGRWSDFFSVFDDYDADYISTGIRPYAEAPGWAWWSLKHPQKSIPLKERFKSLNPIYRLSRKAMQFLMTELATGWKGHSEILLPTLIYHNPNLSLMDMGDNAPFTPEKLKNTIYKTVYGPKLGTAGNACFGSTFHHRPPILFWGLKRNYLYHPIKPLSYYIVYRLK